MVLKKILSNTALIQSDFLIFCNLHFFQQVYLLEPSEKSKGKSDENDLGLQRSKRKLNPCSSSVVYNALFND